MVKKFFVLFLPALTTILLFYILTNGFNKNIPAIYAQSPVYRVNAPYFNNDVSFPQSAIFWFGQVDSTNNYVDVRTGYNSTRLEVHLVIFDRRVWYDQTPSAATLEEWDAATLYLNTENTPNQTPSTTSYRFVSQVSQYSLPNRADYQTAYHGNGSGWVSAAIPFTTPFEWQGDGLNGADDRGWRINFVIPFSSLGLSAPPAEGTIWHMALALHDRDSLAGPAEPYQSTWPPNLNTQNPSTWNELRFGLPTYTPPSATPNQTVTIRQGLNGVTVNDAHVGGGTMCGQDFDPNYFNGWGNANYAHAGQINIQNQGNVADWPCFSKFYITFPLDSIPADKEIISATLTMHLFGNSDPANAQGSLIQVLVVGQNWDESTITWNNAPQAVENVATTWVEPVQTTPDWPGIPYTWDVSRAVAAAYAAGTSLRLALYEADWSLHSGKYFSSSDTEDWNAAARPTLKILGGNADPIIVKTRFYFPLIIKN